MYLIDTNVVSELRKPKADHHVRTWAARLPAISLFVSVITVLELEAGVLQLERRAAKQGAILRRWLDEHVLPAFADRVLAIDPAVTLRCAQLHVPERMADDDALIAATAQVHGLGVVTRNVADCKAANVKLINPWQAAG